MPIPDIQTPVQRDNTAIHFLPTKDGNEYLQEKLYLAAKRQMEREQKEREEAERKARQERFANMSDAERQSWVQEQWDKTEGLGEADSATAWYHAIEEDPYKEAEWDRNAAITSSIGSTIVGLPFSIGSIGLIPTLTTTATGYAGAYGGQKLGEAIDEKYGTNLAPWFSTIGGIIGGGAGYKGTVNLGSKGLLPKGGQTMYGKQFITDVASDALNRNVTQIAPALNYGTVKYYGPTMGKTTTAKNATKPMTHGDPGLAQDYINTVSPNAEVADSPWPYPYTREEYDKVKSVMFLDEIPLTKRLVDESPFSEEKLDVLNAIKRGEYVPKSVKIPDVQTPYHYLKSDVAEKLGIDSYNLKKNALLAKFAASLDDIPNEKLLPELKPTGLVHKYEGEVPSLWVILAKKYYNRLGLDVSDLSDNDIRKIIQWDYEEKLKNGNLYRNLRAYHGAGSNGKYALKPVEKFEKYEQGMNLGNMGRSGSGYYFSLKPGYSGSLQDFNIQPYVFNNVEDILRYDELGYVNAQMATMNMKDPISGYTKHLFPLKSYLTSGSVSKISDLTGVPIEKVRKILTDLYPDESRFLVSDPEGNTSTIATMLEGPSIDFRYRGPSQNIKSLFPHPDRFIQQPDGSVILKPTDWNDPRSNFKHGGKIINPA